MTIPADDVRRYVAAEVRAAFARKRLSVREAARRLAVGQTWLHRRVAGEIPFDVGELAEIADMLDVPVEQFFKDRPRQGFRKVPLRHLTALA